MCGDCQLLLDKRAPVAKQELKRQREQVRNKIRELKNLWEGLDGLVKFDEEEAKRVKRGMEVKEAREEEARRRRAEYEMQERQRERFEVQRQEEERLQRESEERENASRGQRDEERKLKDGDGLSKRGLGGLMSLKFKF